MSVHVCKNMIHTMKMSILKALVIKFVKFIMYRNVHYWVCINEKVVN